MTDTVDGGACADEAPFVFGHAEPLLYKRVEPTREETVLIIRSKHPGAGRALAELADRETGGPQRRHAERVAATKRAALHWASEILGYYYAESSDISAIAEAGAIAILFMDLVGVGGARGLEGASTARHPAFVTLGSGGKQSRDGGAWMAAAEQAFYELARERRQEDPAIYFRMCESGADAGVGEPDGVSLHHFAPAKWLESTMTHIALASIGVNARRDFLLLPWMMRLIASSSEENRVEEINGYWEKIVASIQADRIDARGYLNID